jgi:hypothetical protein
MARSKVAPETPYAAAAERRPERQDWKPDCAEAAEARRMKGRASGMASRYARMVSTESQD